MNNIIILVGPPGAGKTSWIEKNNLNQWTICPDELRKNFYTFRLSSNGNFIIPFDNTNQYTLSSHDKRISFEREKLTWKFLRERITDKMREGETIFVDATHVRRDYINPYVQEARKYRYKVYAIPFKTDLKTLIIRNQNRGLKNVPKDVLERMLLQMENLKLPSQITVLDPDEAYNELINIKWFDISNNYENVFVLGDIHGVLDTVERFMDKYFNEKDLFVFLGDLIDRGNKSFETLLYLMELQKKYKKNIVIIQGNHEAPLFGWAIDDELLLQGKRETKHTIKEIIEKLNNDEDKIRKFKKELRIFFRNVFPYRSYLFNGLKLFLNHAGIPTIDKIGLVPTSQLFYGVGSYDDAEYIANVFHAKHPDIIQIHGHRNVDNLPIRVLPNVYNLEGGIEFGGALRALRIGGKDDIEEIEIKSEYIAIKVDKNNTLQDKTETIWKNASDDEEKIKFMKNHPLIKVVHQKSPYKHIISLNFSGQAFRKGIWDNFNLRARGLFWDEKNKRVAIRGYNKFFNYNENEFTSEKYLKQNLKYPVKIWKKYNGFLLLVGYDIETDSIIYATKSRINSSYVDIAMKTLTEKEKEIIENYLKEYKNHSLLFEVVNPELDPHIVDSEKSIWWLQTLENDLTNMIFINTFNFPRKKELYAIANSWDDILNVMKKADEEAEKTHSLEGLVFEDSNKYMFKYKTRFYKKWKRVRWIASVIKRTGYIEPTTQGFEFPELISISRYLVDHKEEIPEDYWKNIPKLRKYILERI